MATKYVSTLTGAQMDKALTDMNNHISEAWAVGERNGTPVTSGDETYHNNAKYYAEQAGRVVSTGTAAVRYDIAQILTETEQAQARENIGANYSNPNLLDNPFFTINQRGLTTYTSNTSTYTFDRWFMVENSSAGGVKLEKTSDGVLFTKTTPANSSAGRIAQKFEPSVWDNLRGKQITFSITYKSTVTFLLGYGATYGGVYSTNISCSPSANWITVSATRTVGTSSADYWFSLTIANAQPAGTVEIKAIKLELGTVSTIASDSIPDPTDELYKCMTAKADSADTYSNKTFNPLASNPNLLDNPFFTVNQRGQTTYTNGGSSAYTADRWRMARGSFTPSTKTFVSDTSTDGLHFICQPMVADKLVVGEVYTLSSIVNGVTHSLTFTYTGENADIASPWVDNVRVAFYKNTSTFGGSPTCYVQIRNTAVSKTITIKAVKLEPGSVSTLANDSAPDYATELLKCQEYCWVVNAPTEYTVVANGYSWGTTNLRVLFSYPTSFGLRDVDITLSTVGSFDIWSPGITEPVTSLATINRGTTNCLMIKVNVTSTAVSAGTPFSLRSAQGQSNAKIIFSKDI